MILRRLYLYLVCAAALVLLAIGLGILGTTSLLFVFNDSSADSNRGTLAVSTAMSIVALPVWGVHFWFAQRFAKRDPYERTSAIRHLYLYFACLVFSIAGMVFLAMALGALLRPVFDNATFNGLSAAQDGWLAVIFSVIWGFHLFVATGDRFAVREEGASATLRRWYMYIALIVGLLTMLTSAQQVLQQAWTTLVTNPRPNAPYIALPAGFALAGTALWGFHSRLIATRYIADDRHSTLRALEGFIAVAVSIAVALVGVSQILYYALARVLGVQNPGGAGNDVLAATAGPGSQALVFGVAWFLLQRRLSRDAGTQEADRQAGVRRLYTNLASLVSLAAWAAGVGGALWTAAEQLEAPVIGVSAPDWKNPISLWITLLAVGLVVWLAHWRQAPWAADRQSLSRRLYVWAALLGSVLAALGGGVGMINAVLSQVFSAHPTLSDPANLNFGHYLAVILVAAGIAVYHLRVLRADAAAKPAIAPAPAPAQVPVPTRPAATPATEPLALHGRRYTLIVTDATDDDVHTALANLPPQAGYRLIPTEETVDVH